MASVKQQYIFALSMTTANDLEYMMTSLTLDLFSPSWCTFYWDRPPTLLSVASPVSPRLSSFASSVAPAWLP